MLRLRSAWPNEDFFCQLSPSSFSPRRFSHNKRRNLIAESELPSLLTIYKDLHTHPELSTHEERTAAIVAKELKAAGCEVTEHFGKYDKPGPEMLRRHRRDEKRRRADGARAH